VDGLRQLVESSGRGLPLPLAISAALIALAFFALRPQPM
jgi:hypothetical protein